MIGKTAILISVGVLALGVIWQFGWSAPMERSLAMTAYNAAVRLYVLLPHPANGAMLSLAHWMHGRFLPNYFLVP